MKSNEKILSEVLLNMSVTELARAVGKTEGVTIEDVLNIIWANQSEA